MKHFLFHLMPYQDLPADFEKHHDSAWVWVPNELYDPEKGRQYYTDYIDQLAHAETLGFDGVCVNEHHQNAYGLMPSPNIIAAMLELPDEILIDVFNAMAATAKIGWNPLLHDPRLESLLPRVTAKTLCLWGENDKVVPVEYGKRFSTLIPDAVLNVIPECGHMIPLEKPDEFVRAVETFLD